MNKKLVTSLGLSQILEKLGVKQESEFWWILRKGQWQLWCMTDRSEFETGIEKKYISAFLSGELGEILKEVDEPFPWYANGSWWGYEDDEGDPAIETKTEAEARGKMLVYLIKEKLTNK